MNKLVLALLISLPAGARAHQVGVSLGTYVVRASGVDVTITAARSEAATIAALLETETTVRAGTRACAPRALASTPVEKDGTRLTLRYACPIGAGELVEIHADFVADLTAGHRHIATVERDATRSQHVVFKGSTLVVVDAGPTSNAIAVIDLFSMGIDHIMMGFDHLAFLLALIIVDRRPRSLVRIVTAFTVAHSASLALATLAVLTPPARVVEPLIAASIIYVGVESLLRPRTEHRWLVTLFFGFIHGFGFASALTDLSLPRAELPSALVCFNAGVEVGQLAVLAVVVPLLTLAAQWRWFARYGVRLVSGGVAAAGAAWLVERLA